MGQLPAIWMSMSATMGSPRVCAHIILSSSRRSQVCACGFTCLSTTKQENRGSKASLWIKLESQTNYWRYLLPINVSSFHEEPIVLISQRGGQDKTISAVCLCVSTVPCLCCSLSLVMCTCALNYGVRLPIGNTWSASLLDRLGCMKLWQPNRVCTFSKSLLMFMFKQTLHRLLLDT